MNNPTTEELMHTIDNLNRDINEREGVIHMLEDHIESLRQMLGIGWGSDYLFVEAINTWGVELQTTVAVEELSELQKAICKYKRNPDGADMDNIAEEMADVMIVLKQLVAMFRNDGAVLKWYHVKTERLAERIEEAKKHNE